MRSCSRIAASSGRRSAPLARRSSASDGSQGHAHALNLKDSGVQVVVGLRPDSSSRAKAEEHGLEVLDIADAAKRGDIVMILLPDEKQGELWREEISDGIAPGNLLLFATASRSTSANDPPEASTSAWSRRRARATWSAASTRKATACPA